MNEMKQIKLSYGFQQTDCEACVSVVLRFHPRNRLTRFTG
jgi:hypothetical protein